MDSNVIECDACGGSPALAVLRDVQRAYQDRLELVERIGGSKKLQMKVEVLQSWVSDLVAQNTLLTSTVEELEAEVTSRLLEKRRHAEIEIELRAETEALRRRLARKDSDLRGLLEVLRRLREFDFYAIDGIHFNEVTESDIFGSVIWPQSKLDQGDVKRANLGQESKKERKYKNKIICDKANEMKVLNDSLKKENLNKDREIRRLNKDIQLNEQTINSLRNELSVNTYRTPDVPKKDAEVMTDICCSNMQECNDVEPVKDSEVTAKEHPMYQAHTHQLEHSVKSSSDLRSLRHMNVALRDELHAMQRVCTALDEQCRVAALRAQFKDEVIHEMRRQLKQAKAKLKEASESKSLSLQKNLHHDIQHKSSASYDSLTIACVQQQPRRSRRVRPDMDLNTNWDCNSAMYEGSGDDASSKAE